MPFIDSGSTDISIMKSEIGMVIYYCDVIAKHFYKELVKIMTH